ncbi:hypothetical protein GCM10027614_21020 [Micromonospora vulcania]
MCQTGQRMGLAGHGRQRVVAAGAGGLVGFLQLMRGERAAGVGRQLAGFAHPWFGLSPAATWPSTMARFRGADRGSEVFAGLPATRLASITRPLQSRAKLPRARSPEYVGEAVGQR